MMTGTLAQYFAPTDYLVGLPLVLLALFAGGVLLMDPIMPRSWRWLNGATSLLGLAFCGVAVARAYTAGRTMSRGFVVINAFFGTYVLDRVTLTAQAALLVAAAMAFLIALRPGRRENELSGAFCALVLLALIGLFGVVGAHDMVLLLVSLQLAALALSVLLAVGESQGPIANQKNYTAGIQWEAAWKFLLPSSLAVTALAFVFSLLYGWTGQTALLAVAPALDAMVRSGTAPQPLLGLVAVASLLVFGTLVVLLPFHSWAPFSLEYAAPSACLMLAAALPLAAWPLAIRLFGETLYPMRTTLVPLFIFAGVLSLIFGTLLMLLQGNLHRFLAYAAMSQTGFMLLGFTTSFSGDKPAQEGLQGVFVALPTLVIALAGCYAIGAVAAAHKERSARIEDFAGLFRRAPFEAMLMTVLLVSLAGLPLGGFWGRKQLLQAMWQSNHPSLAICAAAFSLLALVGYWRLIRRMADHDAAEDASGMLHPVTHAWTLRLIGTLSAIAVVAASYRIPVQNFVKWMLYL